MTSAHAELNDKQMNAVKLSSIVFTYPNTTRRFICDEWQLQKGERIFLHGPSGSGKSTFLNLLSGISIPEKGVISINQTELQSLSQSQRDKFRAQHLGIVFQQFNLIPYLTVLQNLQLAAYFAKTKKLNGEDIQEHLSMLKLSPELLHQAVSNLSVGQRQRVAILRAFVNSPELLLVDEPTSSLDAAARDGFMQMLLSLCDANDSSLIFVSHDQGLVSHFHKHVSISDIGYWSEAKE